MSQRGPSPNRSASDPETSTQEKIPALLRSPSAPRPLDESYKYHAFLTYHNKQEAIVSRIFDDLEDMGFQIAFDRVSDVFQAGRPVILNIDDAIHTSRRVIHFMTPEFLKEDTWTKYEETKTREDELFKGICKAIYIMKDIEPKDIPQSVQSSTYIEFDPQFKFMDKLCSALMADDVAVMQPNKAGNVGNGFAWSFFYGYLNIIMPGFVEHLKKQTEWWKVHCVSETRDMSRKLFIFLPDDCDCKESLEEENIDGAIRNYGMLPPQYCARGGLKKRPYQNSVYSITNSKNETLYFIGEYATPVLAMHEMEQGQIAGLTAEQKHYQCTMFYFTLKQRIFPQCKAVTQGCCLFRYDRNDYGDGKINLADTIYNLVAQEIEREKKADKPKTGDEHQLPVAKN